MKVMKKISQKQLTAHIGLVKWQQHKRLQKLNISTLHSLLINSNPKFIELKQIIQNYNTSIDKGIDRKHLKCEFVQKLFQMLSQTILIPNWENQVQFLDKVFQWSKQGDRTDLDLDNISTGKLRPGTASTRSRPFSAYSRPKSGVNSRVQFLKMEQNETNRIINREKTNIDYDKLQAGDIEFYNGIRTLHPNQQVTRKQLKQYQRKIFYDQQSCSDAQEVQITQATAKKQPQVQLLQQVNPNENLQQTNQIMPDDELGGQQVQDDINIDDLPIDDLEQQVEVVDKLKPRYKAFVKHETQLSKNQINYQSGINQHYQHRNQLTQKNMEDQFIKQKTIQWAKQKSRTKRQQKRRAQSARIITQKIGIGYKPIQKYQQNKKIINFEQIVVPSTKMERPKTAFRSINPLNCKQLIKNCFITSKMDSHINKRQNQFVQSSDRYSRITSLAQKPKKKTFQQILREAQCKVKQEQASQIQIVKQKFAKNKIPFQTNRITKSVTCHAAGTQQLQQYQDQFVGQITGINMIKNPFIKVAKKKKKKKKSK